MAESKITKSRNLLLDTHTLLWFLNASPELSVPARKAIEAESATKFVSIASLWEMAIKISLQKLELKNGISSLPSLIQQNGFELLPITFEYTLKVS